MSKDLSAWVATELGGRVTKTGLRTGALLRRTSKIVAQQDGLSWECYVNAVSAWLWINNRGSRAGAAFSVNRRSPGTGLLDVVDRPFERLTSPVFTRPGIDAREESRRLESLIEALRLTRFEYFTITPDQITLWNRRPTIHLLRRRIQLLCEQFRDG